jgi:hypothetical protein
LAIRFIKEVAGLDGEEMDKGIPRRSASVDASEKLSTAVIETTVDAIQRFNDLSDSERELSFASSENCLAIGTTENAITNVATETN